MCQKSGLWKKKFFLLAGHKVDFIGTYRQKNPFFDPIVEKKSSAQYIIFVTLRLGIILPVVSYNIKGVIFYNENLKLAKIIILIMFFAIEFFFLSLLINFLKIMAYFFGENIFYKSTLSNFKNEVFSV